MDHRALHKLSYGLYIIGSRKDDRLNAQVANTVFQVTAEPPVIAVSINKGNLTHEFITASGVFSASTLCSDTPLSFIGNFGFKSGREMNKLDGIAYKIGETGAPVITENAVAYLEARVIQQVDVGTHTLFIGEVVSAEVMSEKACMTYDYYRQVKRGTAPAAAPSYTAEERKAGPRMAKYRCTVCGYIYDTEMGDPESNIKPGTPFEQLPDDWTCPVCGASKGQFEKMEE
ncbi:MAG: rubredoxin [Chloroflexi bacterium]|nr:rubredoxin [Chloroflexota bacterium]